MTLQAFVEQFAAINHAQYRFEYVRLVRGWVVERGAAYPVDPLTATYHARTGQLLSVGKWLTVATKAFKLTEEDAWLLRYAADNRAPVALKSEVMKLRKVLVDACSFF